MSARLEPARRCCVRRIPGRHGEPALETGPRHHAVLAARTAEQAEVESSAVVSDEPGAPSMARVRRSCRRNPAHTERCRKRTHSRSGRRQRSGYVSAWSAPSKTSEFCRRNSASPEATGSICARRSGTNVPVVRPGDHRGPAQTRSPATASSRRACRRSPSRWLRTVFSLMKSWSAICWLFAPLATSSSTSRSRPVRRGQILLTPRCQSPGASARSRRQPRNSPTVD